MTVKDCVKAMMKDRGYTQTILAEKIGKRQSDIGMYLMRSEKMQINNLMNMANACNFDIAFIDRKDQERMYVIGEETGGATDTVKEEPKQESMEEMFQAFQEWYKLSHPGR